MSPVLDTTVAMTALKGSVPAAPHATNDPAKARSAAQQFEAVFITQCMGEMFSGVSTDGPFGGGQGEAMFRSLMMDEYGKQIAAQGGFGIADPVMRQILKMQESGH